MSLHRSSYHPVPHDDDSDEDSWHDVRRQSAVRSRPPPLHEDQQQQQQQQQMGEDSFTTVHRTNVNGTGEEPSSEEFSGTDGTEERLSDPLETNAFDSMHRNSPHANAPAKVESLNDDDDNDEGWEDGDEEPEIGSFGEEDESSQTSEEYRKEQQQQPLQQRNSRRSYYSSNDNDESSGYSEYDPNYNYSQDGCSNQERGNATDDDEEAPFVDNNNNENNQAQNTDRTVASPGMKSSILYLYGGILFLCLSLVFSILAIVYRDAT